MLALLIASSSSLVAAESWWDAYHRGVDAAKSGKPADAIQALGHAIADMPRENANARIRNDAFAYLPHFWLGMASLDAGDADSAIRELKISEEQGEVQKTPQYAQLQDALTRAQSHNQHGTDNTAGDARKLVDGAIRAALSAQTQAVAAGADRSETYRAAQRKLQEALAESGRAGASAPALHHVADNASQARELFLTAADDAKEPENSTTAATAAMAPDGPAPARRRGRNRSVNRMI